MASAYRASLRGAGLAARPNTQVLAWNLVIFCDYYSSGLKLEADTPSSNRVNVCFIDHKVRCIQRIISAQVRTREADGVLVELQNTQRVLPARLRSLPRRWRITAIVAATVLSGFVVLTARLFVWPEQGMPPQVDAVVMLNGSGSRLNTALRLGWEHRAPALVISRGSQYWGHGSICAPKIPRVTVICFDPTPSTTQGEAEFVGRLARQRHWRSIVLVTTAPQDTRARLRLERCFSGEVYVMTAPFPAQNWPYELVYEWGATVKALFLQRAC